MKKLLCVFLSVSFLFAVATQANAMPAFYQTLDGDLSLEEGAEVVIFTPDEQAKNRARLAQASNMRISFPAYTELSMPWFKQENGHYCGPATVKQVLHYINNTSLSQDDYAKELGTTSAGTDMTKIPGVLNAHIVGGSYAYADIGNAANWLTIVRTSLYNDRPAILDINTNENYDFPYRSSGHFVNVSGYDGVPAKVRITDPNDSYQHAWYTVNSLYGANSAHWRKAIIW